MDVPLLRLGGIYIACILRKKGTALKGTFGELSNKTRKLIEENTTFLEIAQSLPEFKIDKDYVTELDELPSAADKAAALKAYIDAELAEKQFAAPARLEYDERGPSPGQELSSWANSRRG
jgi:hypothetical protein